MATQKITDRIASSVFETLSKHTIYGIQFMETSDITQETSIQRAVTFKVRREYSFDEKDDLAAFNTLVEGLANLIVEQLKHTLDHFHNQITLVLSNMACTTDKTPVETSISLIKPQLEDPTYSNIAKEVIQSYISVLESTGPNECVGELTYYEHKIPVSA